MKSAQATTNDDLRELWGKVLSLKDDLRLRSPAQIFKVVYQGAAQIQKGSGARLLPRVVRMQIELEGLLETGHFPPRGRSQDLEGQVRLICSYIQSLKQAKQGDLTAPKWSKEHAKALRDVMIYMTDYIGRYKGLNGHLPLFGPYSSKTESHPWDGSPWREAPYDNWPKS